MAATTGPSMTLDSPVVVKIQFRQSTRKVKLPLKDMTAQTLPNKLRAILQLQDDDKVIFERYSDSQQSYVVLDPEHPQVYKTLFRAAKAKLKLTLRATLVEERGTQSQAPAAAPVPVLRTLPPLNRSPFPLAPPVIARTPHPSNPLIHIRRIEKQPQPAPQVQEVPSQSTKSPEHKQDPMPQLMQTDLAFRPSPQDSAPWKLYCNHCNILMEDEHYHCSICELGDYDLCPSCKSAGFHCRRPDHWMVKRSIKGGQVEMSTTERISIARVPEKMVPEKMPGAFAEVHEERQPAASAPPEPEEADRTCNCCVKVLPEKEFVTCTTCDDYDLCLSCHTLNKHGHHPGHAFKPATNETELGPAASTLCNPGRNIRHCAVCDGCEKFIYGVRHKCLVCPDWDYCSDCIKNSKRTHPRHRFVPIYDPLEEPHSGGARHYGIYCDGPLCKDKDELAYIEGIRYKCAVCHDTDFCANCEALPTNKHNHTHPLIKFKTPVRNVSVTTLSEPKSGMLINRLGDKPHHIPHLHLPERGCGVPSSHLPQPTINTATQVQTIHSVKPTEDSQVKKTNGKISDIRNLLAEPLQPQPTLSPPPPPPAAPAAQPRPDPVAVLRRSEKCLAIKREEFDAHFVRDAVKDGTEVPAGQTFVQVWTLRNPGPTAWPAGCSVRHVGGDNMLDVDNTLPLSQRELADASESNIMGRPVEAGEEISFRVTLKAPSREGTFISYWRLKTAKGLPFGHRLWCHIEVVSPIAPSAPPSETRPAMPAQMPTVVSNKAYPEVVGVMTSAPSTSSVPSDPPETMSGKDRADSNSKTISQQTLVQEEPSSKATSDKDGQTSTADVNPHPPSASDATDTQLQEELQRVAKLRQALIQRMHWQRCLDLSRRISADLGGVDQPPKQETAESPVPEKSVETQTESSGMIFPQLEKESPESSTHEAVSQQPESAAGTVSSEQSDAEFFEDAESVDIRSVSSDGDEGFMTDEEYDILNASDEETA